MRDHLSEEQFNEWMLGIAGIAASQHLESCTQCRREAEELRQALSGFRDSIHTTATGYKLPWRAPARRDRRAIAWFSIPRWAYAAAVATILTASVVLLRVDSRRASHQVLSTVSEDEILMQIQTDIGQDVPEALAPGELLATAAAEAQQRAAVKPAGKKHSGRR